MQHDHSKHPLVICGLIHVRPSTELSKPRTQPNNCLNLLKTNHHKKEHQFFLSDILLCPCTSSLQLMHDTDGVIWHIPSLLKP